MARVTLPEPVPPGGSVTLEIGLHVASCRRCSRARGTRTTSTSSASGSRSSASTSRRACAAARRAGGTATSSTRTRSSTPTTAGTRVDITVPSDYVVGATGVRTARAHERQRHDHLHVRAGRRPRLRVDRRPGLRRRQGDVLGDEGRDAGRVRSASRSCSGGSLDEVKLSDVEITRAPAARSPAAGAAPHRLGEGGAQVVRAVVRAVSLQDADRRRPRARRRRRRRHGVPDVHHGGIDLAVELAGPSTRSASSRRSPSTSSATSSGTAWSAATSSRRPGSTRASTPTRPAR